MLNKINFMNSYSKVERFILIIITISLSLLIILPFIYIAQYNVPGASDDLFHGFNKIDKSYIDGIYYWYKNGYNGRFANAIFMLIPGRPFLELWFGKFFPMFIFFSFFSSILYFIKSIFNKIKKYELFIYSLIFMLFNIAFIPDIKQFYWYSGMTVYVIPGILYLFLLGFLFRNYNKKQNFIKTFIPFILIFLIIGSNENWMVIVFITNVLFFFNEIIEKKTILKSTYAILIWAVLCTLLMLLAPGTIHRIDSESNSVQNAQFIPSVLISIQYIGDYIINWFFKSGLFIAGIAIMFRFKTERVKHNILKAFSNIHIFLLFLFVIYIGVFIMLFSLGHLSAIRLRGIIPTFFVSVILFFGIFIRLSQTSIIKKLDFNLSTNNFLVLIIFALIVGASNSDNLKNVYNDIFTGNAEKQAKENVFVLDYLKNTKQTVLSIPQLKQRSKILYSFTVPEHDKGWQQWVVTQYFNKKKVSVDKTRKFKDFMKNNMWDNNEIVYENKKKNIIFQGHSVSNKISIPLTTLYQTKDSSIQFSASINVKNLEKGQLVFHAKPFWKGIPISKITNKTNKWINIKYIFKVPSKSNLKDKLNVYFLNTSNDTIQISNMKVVLWK